MITPLRNRFVIRPLIDKESGSIQIPDQFKQQQTAEIVAIPAESTIQLHVGAVVMLHPNAAWAIIEHEGEHLRVVGEEYLLAIMETTHNEADKVLDNFIKKSGEMIRASPLFGGEI